MAKIARRPAPTLIPDLFEWLDTPWSGLLPFTPSQTFRIEDYVTDDHYIVRAELPGVDPDKDVEVTVGEGTLTIHAERHEEEKEPHRSEFRYGSLTRSVALPARADTRNIKASYTKGILEVSVPVPEHGPESKRIPIRQAD